MMNKKLLYKNPHVMTDEDADSESLKPSKDISSQFGSNQIFFYDDITKLSIYALNRQLDIAAKTVQVLKINYNLKETPPIDLYVGSDGGEVFSAFSAVDRIKSSIVPVHSYVEGMAASAATLLTVCAHKRFIRKNGFMLIHQVRGGLWGPFEEIKEEVKNLELIMSYIRTIYLQHTKFTESDLDDLLKQDLYLDANDCLKYGLVDEIV
jgi:ATP-dependent protease ClpP protease subunit